MVNQFAYLLFHLVITSSLGLSKIFYRKMVFPSWRTVINYLPVSLFFIVWDSLVTNHWWFFNHQFVLGWELFNLPLEEISFFIVVPFALLTLVENLKIINFKFTFSLPLLPLSLFLRLSALCLAGVAIINGWWYTASVLGLFFIFWQEHFLKQKEYFWGLVFTLLTTLIFNYYLTALPVVEYNQLYKSGLLIGTIPVEDFIYGILLYIFIINFSYEWTFPRLFKKT